MRSAMAYRSGRPQTHAQEWRISQWLGRILFVVLLLSMIDAAGRDGAFFRSCVDSFRSP